LYETCFPEEKRRTPEEGPLEKDANCPVLKGEKDAPEKPFVDLKDNLRKSPYNRGGQSVYGRGLNLFNSRRLMGESQDGVGLFLGGVGEKISREEGKLRDVSS